MENFSKVNETCFPLNPDWFHFAENISYLVILPALAIFGIIGNSLIIAVYITNRRERTRSVSVLLSYGAIWDNALLP